MAIRESNDVQLGPWGENGGVRYDLATEDVSATEISAMQNCTINPAGAIEKRLGTASYGGYANISSDPTVTMCAQFTVNPNTQHIALVAGTKIWKDSGSAFVSITPDSGLTITAADDNTFEWADANGALYATNGVNAPFKWTGTSNAAAAGISSRFTTAEHIVFWDNRLWYANTDTNYDRIWYSDLATPETIAATSFINLGSKIEGLKQGKDFLAVHCRDGIHTISPTGNASIPYQRVQVTARASISGRAIVTLPGDRQLFIRKDGFYLWESGQEDATKHSHSLDLGYWDDVNSARLLQSHGIYYPLKNEAWFWLPKGSTSEMEEIIIYNNRLDKFYGPMLGSGTYFKRNCSALIDNKPHAGTYYGSGDIGGKLEDHAPASTYVDDDDSANGTPIDAWFRTGAPAPGSSAERQRWRYARTYYDAVGSYSIHVEQESSGVTGTSETLTTTGGFTLGTDLTDVGAIGSLRMLSQDTEMTEYDPHSSLRFRNGTSNQFFRIRRTHLVYTPIGHKRKRRAGVE